MANLLDTNIISQLTKIKPQREVLDWLAALNSAHIYLSVVSLAEIRYGIEMLPQGRKRRDFTTWLENDLPRVFMGRLLSVDAAIADESGRMLAIMKEKGKRPDIADALLAATARVKGLRLATLNRRDFEGLPIELVAF